jgi:hypothetical protein
MAKNALIDSLRARAHGSLGRLPGRFGEKLRDFNEAMGRPLASSDELAERRAFEQGLVAPAGSSGVARSAGAKTAAATVAAAAGVAAAPRPHAGPWSSITSTSIAASCRG